MKPLENTDSDSSGLNMARCWFEPATLRLYLRFGVKKISLSSYVKLKRNKNYIFNLCVVWCSVLFVYKTYSKVQRLYLMSLSSIYLLNLTLNLVLNCIGCEMNYLNTSFLRPYKVVYANMFKVGDAIFVLVAIIVVKFSFFLCYISNIELFMFRFLL